MMYDVFLHLKFKDASFHVNQCCSSSLWLLSRRSNEAGKVLRPSITADRTIREADCFCTQQSAQNTEEYWEEQRQEVDMQRENVQNTTGI